MVEVEVEVEVGMWIIISEEGVLLMRFVMLCHWYVGGWLKGIGGNGQEDS